MSDGPHRSLPMSRAWKKFAERVYNQAFSREEASNALLVSLEQDWRKQNMEGLARKVHEVLSDGQSDLFYVQTAERLKLLRRQATWSPLQHVFLDCVDKVAAEGHSGDDALRRATGQTLNDLATRRARQVEEHYLRGSRQRSGADLRQRVEAANKGLDIAATARHILGVDKNRPPRALAKRTGLDDGVRLS